MSEFVSRLRFLCQRAVRLEWSSRSVIHGEPSDAGSQLRQRLEFYERQIREGEIDGFIFLPIPKGSGANFAELEEALLQEIYLRAPELTREV